MLMSIQSRNWSAETWLKLHKTHLVKGFCTVSPDIATQIIILLSHLRHYVEAESVDVERVAQAEHGAERTGQHHADWQEDTQVHSVGYHPTGRRRRHTVAKPFTGNNNLNIDICPNLKILW